MNCECGTEILSFFFPRGNTQCYCKNCGKENTVFTECDIYAREFILNHINISYRIKITNYVNIKSLYNDISIPTVEDFLHYLIWRKKNNFEDVPGAHVEIGPKIGEKIIVNWHMEKKL